MKRMRERRGEGRESPKLLAEVKVRGEVIPADVQSEKVIKEEG